MTAGAHGAEEAVLVAEIQKFLADNGYGADDGAAESAEQSERIAVSVVAGSGLTEEEELAGIESVREFQRRLFDAGLGWLTGPVEFGGRGLSEDAERILRKEIARSSAPDDSVVRTGTQVLGPTMLRMGTDFIRRSVMPRMHRGDVLVCQLFSEPDAGSDLANIKTMATPTDGGWLVNGQKVWSSGAKFADMGVCIARADASTQRHAGLVAVLVDMKAPGVDVRKIRQMTGGAEFCEVFLDDVFVDADHVIGQIGDGWKVVTDVLMNERHSIGGELLPPRRYIDRLAAAQRSAPNSTPVATRDKLADVYVHHRVAELLAARLRARYGENDVPGPEMALTKLAVCAVMSKMSDVAGEIHGPAMVADGGDQGRFDWSQFVLGAPGLRIGGGTDEVLKNGIGERVLHLPRN